jgi:hypothetical protein
VGPLRQSTPLRRGPSEVTYGWDPWDRFIFLRGHKTRTALTTIRGMPAGILAGFGGIVATDQGIKPPVCASLIGLSSHTEATSTITANPSAKTKFRRGPIPLHAAELPPLCVLVHTGGGGGGRRCQRAKHPGGKSILVRRIARRSSSSTAEAYLRVARTATAIIQGEYHLTSFVLSFASCSTCP